MYDNKRSSSSSKGNSSSQKLGTGRSVGSQEFNSIGNIKKDMGVVMALDDSDADEDIIEINREKSAEVRGMNILLQRASKAKLDRAKNMAKTVSIYGSHATGAAKIEAALQKSVAKISQDMSVSMLDLMEVQADDRGFTKYIDNSSSLMNY
jgi:hypothetical protein